MAPPVLEWGRAGRSVSPSDGRRGEPFSSPGQMATARWQHPNGRIRDLPEPHLYMKSKLAAAADQEPVGIVISRGSRQEQVPAVFAYVWGPAPEPAEEVRETRVA